LPEGKAKLGGGREKGYISQNDQTSGENLIWVMLTVPDHLSWEQNHGNTMTLGNRYTTILPFYTILDGSLFKLHVIHIFGFGSRDTTTKVIGSECIML
jgi:hypothetical protein